MKAISRNVAMAVTALLIMTGTIFADDNTVTVTGKAVLKHKPDVAYVTLYIKADGILMTDAAKKADQKVEEVKKAIQEKFKDIQSFEVSDVVVGEAQREYWGPDRKEDVPRPEIARRLRIATAPNPTQVYELIDTAIRAGALMQIPSSVRYSDDMRSVVVYGLVKSPELESQTREAAMADAKQRAQKLAALAGKKIGDVVNIGCSGSYPEGFPIRVMGREADFPTEHLATNPNEITISHTISVTFELKKE